MDNDRGTNSPVLHIPEHITCSGEHETKSYTTIKTMFIHDGKQMDFKFCISEETGLFHVYFMEFMDGQFITKCL